MLSVTQVLDEVVPKQLANWMKNNSKAKCEQILEYTGGIGNRVDTLIQQDINDGGYVPPNDDQAVMNCLSAWEQVKKEHPLFIGSVKEMQVEIVDRQLEIVGHPDFICKDESGWGVADLKCTSGIRGKNWVQVGKYAQILMQERGYALPSFLRIIRLSREGAAQWLEITSPVMIEYCMGLFDVYYKLFKQDETLRDYFRNQAEEEILGLTKEEKEGIYDGSY